MNLYHAPDYDFAVVVVDKVVDGDTFDLTVARPSPGFGVGPFTYRARFRLVAPGGEWFDVVERDHRLSGAAIATARDWLNGRWIAGVLRGTTHKPDGRTLPDGAFGRWLIDLYDDETGEHLTDVLSARGFTKGDQP